VPSCHAPGEVPVLEEVHEPAVEPPVLEELGAAHEEAGGTDALDLDHTGRIGQVAVVSGAASTGCRAADRPIVPTA
jgi:hypothetical protein